VKRCNIILFSIAMLLRCAAGPNSVAGGTSTTGNGVISGRAVYASTNAPISGAQVRVRPELYLADTIAHDSLSTLDGTTDSSGFFSIDSVDTGRYIVEINDRDSFSLRSACTITAAQPIRNLDTVRLEAAASVAGSIIATNIDTIAPHDQFTVRITGLERLTTTDSITTSFFIGGLPAGDFVLWIHYFEHVNDRQFVFSVAAGENKNIGTLIFDSLDVAQ
jgi:hypothetical protein